VVPLVAPVESNGSHRHLRVTPSNEPTPVEAAGSGHPERQVLRALLRARRAALPLGRRAAAPAAVARHIAATRWLRGRPAIGLYVAVGNELGTGALYALARRLHCRIFLPRIIDYRHRRMVFARAGPAPLRQNRHGIPEPAAGSKWIPARALAVIFLPVLGFDRRGARLGSGAGYYDRLLAFRRLHQHRRRPLLVGLAFRCQELPRIEPAAHDVPLDAIVTEQGVVAFAPAQSVP
jgi:5-formyltetrahydrofolate cyclo-ligase